MKKIGVIGLNYFPEISSTGLYTTEMCEYLSKYFNITVITGYPYYPEWKIKKDYAKKNGILKETVKNIEIIRVKQYVPSKVNPLNRIFHYWDFYHKAFSACKNENYDMVMVILPNIFLLNLAIKLKKRHPNIKIWAHVQDFEIDAGLEMLKGVGKIKPLKRMLYSIEKNFFSKFDIVSTISEGMLNKLKSKGVPKDKKFLLPNWVDINFLHPVAKSTYREELGISDKDFIIMYSGNIGKKEDWDTLISCIKSISPEKDIKFVIAGDGNKKEYVYNSLKNTKNTILMPLQPKKRLNDFLNLGDIHILPQKKNEINSFMPSKVLGIKATGKAILCLANKNSTIYKEILNNDLGYVIDEKNYHSLPDKIKEVRYCKLRTEKGKKAREYVVKNYKYEDIMEDLKIKINSFL